MTSRDGLDSSSPPVGASTRRNKQRPPQLQHQPHSHPHQDHPQSPAAVERSANHPPNDPPRARSSLELVERMSRGSARGSPIWEHRRSASLTRMSPPLPPADFNPLPDFTSDLPLHGITDPSISASAASAALAQVPISPLHLLQLSDPPAVRRDSSGNVAEAPPDWTEFPQLRAMQRLSTDSVASSSPTAGSSAASADSGEVLAQRRDELVSNLMLDDELGRSSTPSSPTVVDETDADPAATLDEAHSEPLSRPRSRSLSVRPSDEALHAWDSVWPASSASRRVNVVDPGPPGPSRFPMAPVSPYVTPSFSPAVVQAQTDLQQQQRLTPTSPPIYDDRPLSPSPAGTPLTPVPRRSSSRSSRSEDASSASSSAQSTSSDPDSPCRARSAAHSPGSPGRPRSSPPVSSRRPDRVPSIINQFPELAPPFISRRELAPPLTRRLSETAIVRRPDASLLLLDGQDSPSPSITTHNEPQRVLDDMGSDPTHLAPTLSRPGIPRRAKSAQDAHGRTRSIHPAIPLALPPGELIQVGEQPKAGLPDTSLHASALAVDEYVIDDDEDDDEDVPTRDIVQAIVMPAPADDSSIELVDEGDLLPSEAMVVDMDVTFDDEGLNTLERIFLLSRSEYAFHRAYVAHVLGDLLTDVDPCESVEYVLPLISAFSLDEDETVKEAFAAHLHRILWHFFTTCQLLQEDDDAHVDLDAARYSPLPETITRLESMPRTRTPMAIGGGEEGPPAMESAQSHSMSSGGESHHSSLDLNPSVGQDTPVTSVTGSFGADADTKWGLGDLMNATRGVSEIPWSGSVSGSEGTAEVVPAPAINVAFFRPLLGTMLLSNNPQVANPTRDGIVHLVTRLRGQGDVLPETWGSNADLQESCRTYLSQTGPHCHYALPFDDDARKLVEQELLHGIILGMGSLSTEVPDSLFNDSVEVIGDDGEIVDQGYEAEMYRQQMIDEATLGRALSLSFIGATSELYTAEEVVEYGFVDEVIRGQDGDVSTRAEAALAIGKVVRVAPPDEIPRLLEAFNAFANDDDSQVRQSACISLAALCKRLQTGRREFAVKAMQVFMEGNDESVQSAALEALGEIIYTFVDDPLGPPHELLEIYIKDRDTDSINDEDPISINPSAEESEWDFLASFNFPGVCLTLGPDRWPELRGLYRRLVNRASYRVFRTIAASLHELAIILRPEQVAGDILPVYRRCLTLDDDIRVTIFEHVHILIACLPQAFAWETFLDLKTTWESNTLGGWRAREQLALHIPSFLETFEQHSEVTTVLRMMRSALLDTFAAVRDAATYAVPLSYEILGRSKGSQEVLHDILLDLAFSSSYRQRLTFVRCLREFIRPPPNREAFEKYFMPSLARLIDDIVDVRLGLAKAVADLFVVGAFYGDEALPVPREIRELAATLADDDSGDVRDMITRIGAHRWTRSTSAESALMAEAATTDDPELLQAVVDNALDPGTNGSASTSVLSSGSSGGISVGDNDAGARLRSLHSNAQLPSEATVGDTADAQELTDHEGNESRLALESKDDPFAASFASGVEAVEESGAGIEVRDADTGPRDG